ncbi:hypothetical protein DYST_00750 [Dyella terrae]|nr:hypothetical protein DYST_00750 [Dyella terrae]
MFACSKRSTAKAKVAHLIGPLNHPKDEPDAKLLTHDGLPLGERVQEGHVILTD